MKAHDQRRLWLAVLAGAVATALIAQLMIMGQSASSAPGFALYAVAITLFIVGLRGLERLPETVGESGETAIEPRWRSLPWLAVALAALSATTWVLALRSSLPMGLQPEQYRLGFALWLVSVAAFVLACVVAFWRPTGRLWQRLVGARWEIVGVAGLTLVAFLLRAINVSDIPYPLQGDEAAIATEGVRVLTGKHAAMFHVSWYGQPNMTFVPNAVSIALFGPGILGGRFWSVVQGTLTVPLLYMLGRRMFGPWAGLIAATILATWHYPIHFSRLAANNIGDAFFAALVFWLLYRATEDRKPLPYVWAGVAAALTWYSYVGARLIFLLALVYLGYLILRQRGFFMESWRGLVLFLASIVVVAGPQMLWFRDHPDEFGTRMNQVGIIQTGWLVEEAARQGTSPLALFARHFLDVLLGWVSLPAQPGFYRAPVALLDPLLSLLFVFGLAYSTVRLLERRYFLLAIWFWGTMILTNALAIEVPNPSRMLLAAPAVCLFIAITLITSFVILRAWAPIPHRVAATALAIFLVAISVSSVGYYFLSYTPRNTFADANSEAGHEIGLFLQRQGPNYVAYFAGMPRMFVGFPSIPYLAPDVKGIDLPEKVTPQTVPALPIDRRAVFLALPDRRRDLELIAQRYPDGEWWEVPSKIRPEPLFFAYEPPAE